MTDQTPPEGTEVKAPWFPEEAKGYVETKGWSDPKDVITSYQNLERFLGADKVGRGVIWPKDDKDTDNWNQVYQKLGRPESPDGYRLPVPEGDSGEFAKAAAPILHQLGLSTKQAEGLAAWLNEYSSGQTAQFQAKLELDLRNDQNTLKNEWGNAFGQQMELARRGAEALGLDQDDIANLIEIKGYANAHRKLADAGKRFAEPGFVVGETKPTLKLTPDGARARLETLKMDRGWLERWNKGDAEALKEWDDINRALDVPAA